MVECKGGRDFGVGFAAWAVKKWIIAKYSVLQENQLLFATKYLPYLPVEEELEAKIEREELMIQEQLGE